MSRHVVVIGGGAIGTACAYYLAKADWRVTLLDKNRQGLGGTSGNCGMISPSHVLPLTEPGTVRKALRGMGRGASPLYIKPRWDPRLWWWLLNFARRCRRSTMLESAEALHALLGHVTPLLEEVIDTEDMQVDWQREGCLFVYDTPEGMSHFAETDRLLREKFDTPATRFDGDELLELEPSLQPGSVAGGWLYEQDSHLDPALLLAAWRGVLERLGVTIREGCEVGQFVTTSESASAVQTTQGEQITADAFVLAAGAWSPLLERDLGCRVPVQPGKGYSRTLPRPNSCPRMPIFFQDRKIVATPLARGLRFGSTMEFSGYDASLNPTRLGVLTTRVEGKLKAFEEPEFRRLTAPNAPVDDHPWYGWRPMTYDSVPIIDRAPALPNVLLATGHNMLGLTLATPTGRLVMEMLCQRPTIVDPRPYRVTRF